jgi:hypothetical protein
LVRNNSTYTNRQKRQPRYMDIPLQRIDMKILKILYLASVKLGPDRGRPTRPRGLAHFLELLIGAKNPVIMGITEQDERVKKPGKEFGPRPVFLDGLPPTFLLGGRNPAALSVQAALSTRQYRPDVIYAV